jgi:RNA recognition motif-containing protein
VCADGQIFPIPYDDYIPDHGYMPPAASGSHYMPTTVPQSQESVDSRKLFVGQLPKEYTEEHLYAIFAQFGNVEDITLLRNEGNESKCCGFVTYKYRVEALGAIEATNRVKIDVGGRPLVVRLANSRRR